MRAAKISDEELFDRLTRVFQDHGYEGASLTRISDATGLERASLYHRFPGGKDEMAEAVLGRVARRFAEDLLAPLQGAGPVAERIRECGRRLKAFYKDGGVSCLLDTLSLHAGSSRLHEAVRSAYAAWLDAFASIAREAGLPPAAAQRRAEEAISGIHGALVLARVTGDQEPFARTVANLPLLLTSPQVRKRNAATRL